MSGQSPEVSVILPAYRSAKIAERHLPVLCEYLKELGVSYEIVVVDDGSDDAGATAAVVNGLGLGYMKNPRNQGKGAAVRRGMLAARGRFRIFTDVDVPYELSTIERILYYLDFKEYHFVAGDRTLDESNYFTRVHAGRVVASHVYSTVVGRLVAGGWFDTQCGIKGFRDNVAQDIFGVGLVNRFAFDVELFYIALKRNYDIKRIPVQLRCNDTSSVSVLVDGAAMVRDLAVIRLNQMRGRYKPKTPVRRTVDSSLSTGYRIVSEKENP